MGELHTQRALNVVGVISLASIPLTGPFGFLAAAGCGAIKLIRKENSNNMESYNKDVERLKQKRFNHSEEQQDRELQKSINGFLKRENERQNYGMSLEKGKEILETHLSGMPYEDYSKIKQVEIYRKEPRKIFGVERDDGKLESRVII